MNSLISNISQQVNDANNLQQALRIIVKQIKHTLAVDVCSVYLIDIKTKELVLKASDGLLLESMDSVRLRFNKGIVGLVAERSEPVNLANAHNHPRYHYFSETGEEIYHGFLGIPIIHDSQTLGVLVIQQSKIARFSENTIDVLMTFSIQIASSISHLKAIDTDKSSHLTKVAADTEITLSGIPSSPGIGVGTAVVSGMKYNIDSVYEDQVTDVKNEQKRFMLAVDGVKNDITKLLQNSLTPLPDTFSALFNAYLLMLESDSFIGEVNREILSGNWAPGALHHVVQKQAQIFNDMDDPYLKQRIQDIKDLANRLLQNFYQESKEETELPEKVILVGEDITATLLADIPLDRLCGVISLSGSSISHTAILASALAIPAVLGVSDLPLDKIQGETLIVDGYKGQLYINPKAGLLHEFEQYQKQDQKLAKELSELKGLSTVTKDGKAVSIFVNTGLSSGLSPALNSGADGIGLFRTEYTFFENEFFPGEEEQRQIYHKVLTGFSPLPVTMRTLDIGGDKKLPYFSIEEENPFLGWRGIRISLDHPDIFLMQIRAMLKANKNSNNLKILLPMISNVSELDQALVLINQAYNEILEEGITIKLPEIGIMIEVPAILYQLEAVSKRVDFFSIGSNDLSQYLLAVDRNNARVAGLYDALNPSVLGAINTVVQFSKNNNIPVNICGEMASEPLSVIMLLGMGINSFSMNALSIPKIKHIIRSFSSEQTQSMFNQCANMETAESIRTFLLKQLDEHHLSQFFRAGN